MTDVTTLPSPFLLELHSERMHDAMLALEERGFAVTHVMGTTNRFKIVDAEAYDDGQKAS